MKVAIIAFALISAAFCISLETHDNHIDRKQNLELNIERVHTYHPAVYREMRDTTAHGFEEANPMFPSHHFRYNKDGSLNLDAAQWNQPKKAAPAPAAAPAAAPAPAPKMIKKNDSSCSDSHDHHRKRLVLEKKVTVGNQN